MLSRAARVITAVVLVVLSCFPVADWLGVTLAPPLRYAVDGWWQATAIIGVGSLVVYALGALLHAATAVRAVADRVVRWCDQHPSAALGVLAAWSGALIVLDAWWLFGDVRTGVMGALVHAGCIVAFAFGLHRALLPTARVVAASVLFGCQPWVIFLAAARPVVLIPLLGLLVMFAVLGRRALRARWDVGFSVLASIWTVLLTATFVVDADTGGATLSTGVATLATLLHQLSIRLFETPVPVVVPIALVLMATGPFSALERRWLIAGATTLAGAVALGPHTFFAGTHAFGSVALLPLAPLAALLIVRFPDVVPPRARWADAARVYLVGAIVVTGIYGAATMLPARIAAHAAWAAFHGVRAEASSTR
jgi:hypothetical protein